MNIKITYNWLLEYLDTDADPYEMQKYLSLSGPSIERVDKVGDPAKGGLTDYVFDIEITTNRIDMASVFGVAQEACAILPQHGKKATLRFNPLKKYTFDSLKAEPAGKKLLKVSIENPDLCPRFTALVFSDVAIKPAPELIKKRLQLVDIKSINNVIDISNYLMLSLGQPTHMFDYDQIKGGEMIVRESKKGEKLVTLDNKEIELPGGDIVIEDGSGKLIDLCGIMGGLNSSITSDTKNVIFFVQTYDKRKIRRTSMKTAQRTVAATYFEKGLDPGRVEQTLVYGVELLNEYTGGIMSSPMYDIYPHPRKEKIVHTYLTDIQRVMGVNIEEKKVIHILENLGFGVKRIEEPELAYPDSVKFTITVPTYRTDDVEIKEDIIEEVARVYGYGNLPSTISPMVYIKQPREIEQLFQLQHKIKYFFKHIGLHEALNYSMISADLIETLELTKADHLKIATTISKEIEYMRLSLIPSLIKNLKENYGKKESLKFFEIAKVYPQRSGELPNEQYKLGIAVDTDFFDLKGIIETLLNMLHIHSIEFKKGASKLLAPNMQAVLFDKESQKEIGIVGKLAQKYQENLGMKTPAFVAELDFSYLLEHSKTVEPYVEPQQYSVVKFDSNIARKGRSYAEIKSMAFSQSPLLINVEYVSSYNDELTLRFYFSSSEKNIREEEAKKELDSILKHLA